MRSCWFQNQSPSTLTVNNSTLAGNSATSSGGGIYNSSGPARLTNSIVAGNTAGISPTNISGPDFFSGFYILTNGDLRLAPLGNYGGPTQTMPPLPGSPAIDAGVSTYLTTDQRGFPRVVNGITDIGAAEFQGAPDVALFWSTDWDGDGKPFGLELALGTDPLVADPNAPGNPAPYPPASGHGIQFGFNSVATNCAAWVVSRSLDLSVPNSFVEIYRFDGPTGVTTTTNAPVSVTLTTNSISIIDNSVPLPPAAFYRLSIEPSP